MNQVVAKLKSIVTKTNNIKNDQIIQNFDQLNIKETESETLSNNETILFEKNLNVIIDEMVDHIFKEENVGICSKVINQHIFDCFNKQSITLQEIFNWLLNNQNNSNFIFLLGYLNYF